MTKENITSTQNNNGETVVLSTFLSSNKKRKLKRLSLPLTLFLCILTLLTPILSVSAKTSFNNYDPAKIKYAKDKPVVKEDVKDTKDNQDVSSTQDKSKNDVKSSNDQEDNQVPPILAPNKLTIQTAGCYYVSKISSDGAGGKLYIVGKNEDGTDRLISDNYNNLTTKSDSILLGNFLSGQDLVLKITPFYPESPKSILSTDSSRVKQVDLGNNSYSLAFEDWLDYDFNDIVLRIEKGYCEDEPTKPEVPTTPTTPTEPQPPTVPTTPTTPIPSPQPEDEPPLTDKEKLKKLDDWKKNENPKSQQNQIGGINYSPTSNKPNNNGTIGVPLPNNLNSTPPVSPNTITPSPIQSSTTSLPTTTAVTNPQLTQSTPQPSITPTASKIGLTSPATLFSSSVYGATIAPNYINNCATIFYDRWCGEYFNNNPYTGFLSYAETFQTSRDFLDVTWGASSPNPPPSGTVQSGPSTPAGYTPVDNFAAKFVKQQWFDGGYYKFYSYYDDAMKLVIDGKVVMDNWGAYSGTSEIRIDVSNGWHKLEVYYQERTGDAKIVVKWELACKDRNNWGDWCVEFYANTYFSEIPVKPVVKTGDFWNENWGNNNPTINLNKNNTNSFSGQYVNSDTGIKNLPVDNFAGYFTKMQYFEAGNYIFTGSADDILEVSIDSQRLITQASCCGPIQVTKKIDTSGWYFMQVKQIEFTGYANISLSWEKDSTPPAGYITNPPPGTDYMIVSGSSFAVTANAYDQGSPQSGISRVDFYTYYDNTLKNFGTSYNTGGVPIYAATLDLTKLSKYNIGSQDIKIYITVIDKAGNITDGAGGDRWVRYQKANSDITSPFTVTSPETVPNCSQGSQCSSNFVLMYGNRYSYDNNRTVWIITHGRGDNTDGWAKDIGNQIHNNYSNDIVLLLDWRNGAGDTSNPPYKSGKFTGPIAKAAKQKLTDWGFSNQDKLNIIGHSLGSLLSAKLSEEMGRAKTLTLLSPPGNAGLGYYDVNPNEKLSSFQGKAQFSRAIVMSGEVADDQSLAKTADEKILVDSPGIGIDINGTKHVANTRLYLQLIAGRKLYNNYLDLNNLNSNNFPLNNSFNARLVTSGNIDTNYLQVNYADRLVNYGSTGGENIPTNVYSVLEDFGNSGDDTFVFSANDSNQLNTIKDFSGNDKIQLSNYYAGAPYYIQSENSYPVIYQSNGGVNYRVGRVEGSKSSNFLTNPNALKESEGLTIYR